MLQNGNQTIITDPNDPSNVKKFTFDFSYWSHDSYNEEEDGLLVPDSDSSIYADQTRVFRDLGAGVLENAFGGMYYGSMC